MLSSLGLVTGRPASLPPQLAPAGGRSSFLSFSAPVAQVGGADLATLLQMCPGGVHNVDERHQYIPSPGYSPPPGPSAPPPSMHGMGVMAAPVGALPSGGVGAFDIRHLSAGKFTEATINNMHKAVLAAKTDAKWRELMETIRQQGRRQGAIGWKDYPGEQRWFNHWYRNVRPIDYVRDPHQVELVMHPKWTYKKALGDCDDSSTLWAASMGALGAPHRFRTYRADPRRPTEWSHVVSQTWVPGSGWVNNDLTIKGAQPGYEPRGYPHKDWPEPQW